YSPSSALSASLSSARDALFNARQAAITAKVKTETVRMAFSVIFGHQLTEYCRGSRLPAGSPRRPHPQPLPQGERGKRQRLLLPSPLGGGVGGGVLLVTSRSQHPRTTRTRPGAIRGQSPCARCRDTPCTSASSHR